MHDNPSERTVVLHFPRSGSAGFSSRTSDRETWLSMLEMLLEAEFTNYIITIIEEKHRDITVQIEFSTVDDAMMFRLQH